MVATRYIPADSSEGLASHIPNLPLHFETRDRCCESYVAIPMDTIEAYLATDLVLVLVYLYAQEELFPSPMLTASKKRGRRQESSLLPLQCQESLQSEFGTNGGDSLHTADSSHQASPPFRNS
jgi:hypothetical protein